MRLEDQVVSLELAKRLKELGVKQESHFSWIEFRNTSSPKEQHDTVLSDIILSEEWETYEERTYLKDLMFYAAPTVAELGERLPLWYYSKRLPDGSWSTDHVSRMDILNTNEKTEADSRAAMLIQIIERKIVRL